MGTTAQEALYKVSYRHTQTAWMPRVAFVAVGAVMLLIALRIPESEPRLAMIGAVALLAIVAFWMTSLTVSVRDGFLRWHFGLGFPRHTVAIDEIVAVETDRTHWWMGWGVRWTSRGWLYNVAGRDVVVIERRHARRVMLGTDEPRKLQAALQSELGARR